MKKGFVVLIAIGVCALMQIGVSAQSFNSVPDTALKSDEAAAPANVAQPVTMSDLKTRLDEAKEMLKSSDFGGGNRVVLAVLNRKSSTIELVSMAKDSFLTKGLTLSTTSQ